MSSALLGKILLYIVIVGLTPGPANIYALSCAIRYGRRHSMGMWLGLVVGFTITVTTAALVCYFIGPRLGHYVTYIKYPGAAYIAWLAWDMMRDKGEETEYEKRKGTFVNGLLMQLTNAKMILFAYTTFGSFVLPLPNPRVGDFVIVWAMLYIAGPVSNLLWLLTGSWLRRYFTGFHRGRSIVLGLALLACAVMLLFT